MSRLLMALGELFKHLAVVVFMAMPTPCNCLSSRPKSDQKYVYPDVSSTRSPQSRNLVRSMQQYRCCPISAVLRLALVSPSFNVRAFHAPNLKLDVVNFLFRPQKVVNRCPRKATRLKMCQLFWATISRPSPHFRERR